MKSLDPIYLEHQSLSHECMRLIHALGEYKGKQVLYMHQTPQVLETLKQAAIIESTESSNRIEGITIEKNRLKAIVHGKSKPRDRSEAEIIGYRNALAEIHKRFSVMEVNSQTILYLHAKIQRGTGLAAGVWKRRDNMIEERRSDGQWITRFIPVLATETPYYIETSCNYLHRLWQEEKISKLLLIASFVFDFLCIHPFTDGNGRLSRLLTVLLLHKAGYEVGKFISLEKIIEDSKTNYYEALHQASNNWHQGTHNILVWLEYFLTTLLIAYEAFAERINALTHGRGGKTNLVMTTIDNFSSPFSISDIERLCPTVSRDLIRVVLNKMRGEKQISCLGKGRGAVWKKF